LVWPTTRLGRLGSLGKLGLAFRKLRPDVILSYCMFPNLVCGLVWRWTGARLCVWNQRDEGLHFKGMRLERLAVRLTRWFLSNSYHGRDFLVQKLGVEPRRIQVVYNGVELEEPVADRAAWRHRLGVDESCFLACMVANLHHFKDHATLLRAWRQVIDRLPRGSGYVVAEINLQKVADTRRNFPVLEHRKIPCNL